jgi:CHRD domain-containing protein
MMKQSITLTGVLFAAVLLTMVVAPVTAGAETVKTRLIGYQETPSTINSAASGEFTVKIKKDGTAIDYVLTYRDLSSPVTQSHIHFGRAGFTGGIVLFLCTNLTPPAGVPTPQTCPAAPAIITGTLTAADVIAVPGQGIDPGDSGFAEMVQAIRRAAAYVNVHTVLHPSGEIRGRLPASGHDNP